MCERGSVQRDGIPRTKLQKIAPAGLENTVEARANGLELQCF